MADLWKRIERDFRDWEGIVPYGDNDVTAGVTHEAGLGSSAWVRLGRTIILGANSDDIEHPISQRPLERNGLLLGRGQP